MIKAGLAIFFKECKIVHQFKQVLHLTMPFQISMKLRSKGGEGQKGHSTGHITFSVHL